MRTGAEPEPFKLAVGIADHCVATQLFLSQIAKVALKLKNKNISLAINVDLEAVLELVS